MQIIFNDNNLHKKLAPFSLTRPIAEIRFGILTIAETWQLLLSQHYSNLSIGYLTEEYLYVKYKKAEETEDTITVAGNIKPTLEIVNAISNLKLNESLFVNNKWTATRGKKTNEANINITIDTLVLIEECWHIFQKNSDAIAIDYALLTKNRKSIPLSDTNRVGKYSNQIFIEEGAKVEHAILNADSGPIYIGKNAEIMEGAIIRGPFAMLEGAVVKMAAKIYGATTIGPFSKVGGEISNAVFQAYSNKGHDGFLGNSVIGEWCNLGADTNSSNLKNNYSNVKIYSYATEKIEPSDILFCGLLMGDHSKTGINTMLNTATVVGVSANIFGAGFPDKYIPSYTWGGVEKTDRFILEKAFEVAENMMGRRKIKLSKADKSILTYLY